MLLEFERGIVKVPQLNAQERIGLLYLVLSVEAWLGGGIGQVRAEQEDAGAVQIDGKLQGQHHGGAPEVVATRQIEGKPVLAEGTDVPRLVDPGGVVHSAQFLAEDSDRAGLDRFTGEGAL